MANPIISLHARQVLDSRGNPTVEVEMSTVYHTARAIVPSGASTGTHEALELRDGDKSVYMGKGVLKAVSNINTILAKQVIGMDPTQQEAIDTLMCTIDGTENKTNLGANAILGVSMAALHLGAMEKKTPLYKHITDLAQEIGTATIAEHHLPVPLMNVINGGAHADSGLDIQEFMIVPFGATTFSEALRFGAETFHHLKKLLSEKGLTTTVGDEGGFAPHLENNEAALKLLVEAVERAGHTGKIGFALDVAANEFYTNGMYHFDGVDKTAEEMITYYEYLAQTYPLLSIEDGLAEDDWSGWQLLTARLGNKMQLVGDDLFVTNPKRLQRGIDEESANAILIKLNQIGTVTETIRTIALAYSHGYNAIMSHRSGESEDVTIADFAVGMGTGQIKTGSLSRTDRIAKYNQLLRIEEMLGEKAMYISKLHIDN